MHLFLLFVLCAVGCLVECTLADEDSEVKRGVFPFMAFVYYSDKTIVDRTGARLARGAVLIRPEWLISSSLEDGETSLAFPKETLVARLGAIKIDSRFTFNEDEDEQEREIVKIARPYKYRATEWWVADISLLKTLLPFKISSAVAPVAINANPQAADKGCFILVYAAINGNKSEDKMLMQLSVDMLISEPENCGSNFIKNTMMCATDSENLKRQSNFCEGNSGSPLICDNDVVGIQTYIDDCKPPHLYQRLSSWENLITCTVEDKCHEEQCGTICKVINKDPADFPTEQALLPEAKIYPDEYVNHSSDGMILSTAMMRRLLPDDSKSVSDNDSNNEVSNTETTTSTSSTVLLVYPIEKETDMTTKKETVKPTVTEHTEEEQETSTTYVSTVSTSYNTEEDTTQHISKSEELVNKLEELKTIEENVSSNNSQVQEEHPTVRSAARVNMQCPCYVMSAYLILFYLRISIIVNSF